MKNPIKRIREYLSKRKTNKLIADIKAKNPNPRVFKVWEHKGWGDRISISHVNEDGTFQINGHLATKPVIGDSIVYECQSEKKGMGIVIDTDYPGNPWDMFFATVMPMEIYNEKD